MDSTITTSPVERIMYNQILQLEELEEVSSRISLVEVVIPEIHINIEKVLLIDLCKYIYYQ